jgi:hypothetical protein
MVRYRIHFIELFLVHLVKAIRRSRCTEAARVPFRSRGGDGNRSKHVDPDFLYAGSRQALVHLFEYRSCSGIECLI